MKLLFCTLLAIASLVSLASCYNATWGKRYGADFLLLSETVFRSPVKNSYSSVNVDFPKPGQANTRNITAIYVYDKFTNSSGAAPSLWSGGPGYRFASINLKSQFNQGINSLVEIYGK